MAILLSCRELAKAYGPRPLFEGLSFGLFEGERAGLIGPNGTGKSTLLKILAGQETPDAGEFAPRRGLRVGYLAQRDRVEELAPGTTVKAHLAAALAGLGLQDYEIDTRVAAGLDRAGFTEPGKDTSTLSGGWRKRLAILAETLREPDLLLLDEPTNHLDLEGVLWLEKFLEGTSLALLVVTHDRRFLERVCNRVIELDKRYPQGHLSSAGNYSKFLENREIFLDAQASRYAPYGYTYNKQAKLLELVESEAEVVRRIYALYLEGKSSWAIGVLLAKQGIRNRKGKCFGSKAIFDILKNQIYTGTVVWNARHYDKTQKTPKGYKYVKNPPDKIIIAQGKHKAILSDEVFAQAQKRRAERRISCRRARPGDYLLSGTLFCEKCNHKYIGASSVCNHRTGATKKWYRCSARNNGYSYCSNKSVKATDVEPQVEEYLELLLRNDDFGSRWTNMTFPATPPPEGEKQAKTEAKARLARNLEQQRKLTDIFVEGHVSKEAFEEKNQSLYLEAEELKKLVALYELRQIDREKSADYLARVNEYVSVGEPGKGKPDNLTRKRALNLVFRNIKISDKKIKNAEFFAPFNYYFFEENKKCRNRKNRRTEAHGTARIKQYSLLLSDAR